MQYTISSEKTMNDDIHISQTELLTERIAVQSDVTALRNFGPETKAAVLANSHVKIILKLDGTAG